MPERMYLGGYGLYRKRNSGGLALERETLHVMDGTQQIAMVETKMVDTSVPAFTPVPRMRFQYGNHLDSAMLECDGGGLVISYEESHPYGTAAYRSARSGVEISERRYRYKAARAGRADAATAMRLLDRTPHELTRNWKGWASLDIDGRENSLRFLFKEGPDRVEWKVVNAHR